MSNFTPGPWVVNYDRDDDRPLEIATAADRDLRVAFTASNGNPADAALLATAPDLLAALKEVDRLSMVIESAVRRSDLTNYDAILALLKASRAAIAKAETNQGKDAG